MHINLHVFCSCSVAQSLLLLMCVFVWNNVKESGSGLCVCVCVTATLWFTAFLSEMSRLSKSPISSVAAAAAAAAVSGLGNSGCIHDCWPLSHPKQAGSSCGFFSTALDTYTGIWKWDLANEGHGCWQVARVTGISAQVRRNQCCFMKEAVEAWRAININYRNWTFDKSRLFLVKFKFTSFLVS